MRHQATFDPDLTHHHDTRPPSVFALIAVMGFQAVSGLVGGFGLVADPSGSTIGLPLDWLTEAPFTSYLVPGLVLLLLLGVVPALTTVGLWRRAHWSWAASLAIGVTLLLWLGVEIAVVGYQDEPPLQALYGAVGLLLIGLTSWPAVRRHLDD